MMGPEAPPVREEMESLALSDPAAAPMDSSFASPTADTTSPSSSSSSPFIDPPSYAEAVFSPFEPKNGAVPVAGSASSRRDPSPRSVRAAASDYLMIAVSDPETAQETSGSLVSGTSTYVTYLISSRIRPAAANGGPSEFRVRRRFRDFITLASRLAEAYRGYFIPLRPDKNIVDGQMMQKNEFVEQRRVELERYLWRLAEHPVIGRSDEVRVFLQAEGKLPLPTTTDVASRMLDGAVRLPKQLFGEGEAAHVTPEDVVQPATEGRDLLRMFKELKQAVSSGWGGVKPLIVEEDKEFLERKDKMLDLEEQLSATSQQAEELVKAQQDISETMGELGMAFIKLIKFENEEVIFDSQKARIADAKCVATAAVKASRLCRELNAQTVKHLATLHEYLGVMLAVHSAFSDRASALLTVQTLMTDLSALHARVEKLEASSSRIFGGDQSRLRKVEELKGTIRSTEEAKCCALREYERIKENIRTELRRLDTEMHDDFLNMIKGLVVNQAGYWEKVGNAWTTVEEETSFYLREKN